MLVCKHWHAIVTGIWASLNLGTTTPKDAVISKLERNQWVLDVVVDTEIDCARSTPPEGAYQAIFAAIEATDRWRSFVVETFPPQADLPEHLVNSRLQGCSGAVMNRIRTFKIKCACEMSPLLDHLLRVLGKSANRELMTVEINSPSVISFLAPTYSTIFHSVKVLSLDTPGLNNPVDLLPHLHQLESLTASHLTFPIYTNDVNLPLVHTLRHLSLKAVSIQWMSGRTFRALESCTLFLPLHRHVLHTFSSTFPNCKELTFQGYPLNIPTGISAHNLIHLSVGCSSSWKPRGDRELVQFSSQALRQSRLSPRILHLSIEATSEAWIVALALMSDLEELVIENARPSLGAKALRSLVVQPVYANNLGTTATPGCRKTPVCPLLRRFGLRYRRWLRPSEHFDLIPEFMSIILSRQQSKFPLQSFQIWIRGDEKDPLELIDRLWISLEGFQRLMDASAINVLQAMASKVVENMVKPSGKPSTACPQRPLALQPLLPSPRTPPPAPPPPLSPLPNLPTPRVLPPPPADLLDLPSSTPDPVSSRSLTVLVRRSYKDQRYKEINLIEGEYIYDVERFDDKWWRGTTVDGKRGIFPASYVKKCATPNEAELPQFLHLMRPAPKIRRPPVHVTRPYEAEKDNEINLIEGEYIYDVKQFDDKRWRGTTMDGKRGDFPASYVKECATPDEAELPWLLHPMRAAKIRLPRVHVTRPYEAQKENEINLVEGEYIYDVDPFDDKRWRGTTVDGKRGNFPASYVKECATPNEAEVPPPVLSMRLASKNRGVQVIHPYEAKMDNEINLIEGEYIYDVEPIGHGWWRGTTADGKIGLFPMSGGEAPQRTGKPSLEAMSMEACYHREDKARKRKTKGKIIQSSTERHS